MLYYIILYHIILYYIISCYIILNYIISYYIILYHTILCSIIVNHIISYHIISYSIISYYIILYHTIFCYIILYHIISYHIIYYIYTYNVNLSTERPMATVPRIVHNQPPLMANGMWPVSPKSSPVVPGWWGIAVAKIPAFFGRKISISNHQHKKKTPEMFGEKTRDVFSCGRGWKSYILNSTKRQGS